MGTSGIQPVYSNTLGAQKGQTGADSKHGAGKTGGHRTPPPMPDRIPPHGVSRLCAPGAGTHAGPAGPRLPPHAGSAWRALVKGCAQRFLPPESSAAASPAVHLCAPEAGAHSVAVIGTSAAKCLPACPYTAQVHRRRQVHIHSLAHSAHIHTQARTHTHTPTFHQLPSVANCHTPSCQDCQESFYQVLASCVTWHQSKIKPLFCKMQTWGALRAQIQP